MSRRPSRLLVVAPHPDDETLGAAGTIAGFTAAGGEATVLTVAAHMPPLYSSDVHERTVSEARLAHKVLGVSESIFLDFPAVLVADLPRHELNNAISEQIQRIQPDVVLTPFFDRHIDHRLIFESVMVATRPVGSGRGIQCLATYEVVSETHWNAPHVEPNFVPSWFVDITDTIEAKIEAMACYSSQIQAFPGPRSLEALRALALFRGSQVSVAYAEAFQLIRFSGRADVLSRFRQPESEE